MKNAAIESPGDLVVRWGWVLQTVAKAGFAVYLLLGLAAILAF